MGNELKGEIVKDMGLKYCPMGMVMTVLTAMLVSCAPWPTEGPIQYMTDKELNHKVKKAVQTAVPSEFPNLKISTFDSYVRFAGRFNTEDKRKAAVEAARRVAGVRDVLDYTVVVPARTAAAPQNPVTL